MMLVDELKSRIIDLEAELTTSRQRVKELDIEYSLSVETGTKLANELTAVRRELAALKQQGEPVAWMRQTLTESMDENGIHRYTRCKVFESDVPLYTAQTIPEGWQLVPIEPTEEMIEAAYWNIKPDVIWGDRIAVYKAMLAAAPKPEETK